LLWPLPWVRASLVMERTGGVFAFNSQTALEKAYSKERSVSERNTSHFNV
jgi:hypothetical protein